MRRVVLLLVLVGATSMVVAQYYDRWGRRNRNPLPAEMQWEVEPNFKRDVFTFVRIQYGSYGRRGGWDTDFPDSDYNFSFRLQQLTALKVNPQPVILQLTDPELFSYPWIYIIEPGRLAFSSEEVVALRRYLLTGGFLMVDDFWGEDEYENFYNEIKRVFPEREPEELPVEHPIFSCVFPLNAKPQVPNIRVGHDSQYTGVTWERWDAQTPHYKGIFDDKGRLMVIICHNTDLGDGWEREGDDPWYFEEFAEKRAYPLGINIIFYAMTH